MKGSGNRITCKQAPKGTLGQGNVPAPKTPRKPSYRPAIDISHVLHKKVEQEHQVFLRG